GSLAADLKTAGDTLQARIPWAVDPDAPLPLSEVARLSHPLPWEEQRDTARVWILKVWERGGGAGEGDRTAQLLRDVRGLADRMDSFSFYQVLGLEMLGLLRERQSKKAFSSIGGPALITRFLAAPGVTDEIREHYQPGEE